MKCRGAGKPCFLGDNKNIKDAHRHDVNFDGPDSSPSFIWTPFVNKHEVDIINGPNKAQINGPNRTQGPTN